LRYHIFQIDNKYCLVDGESADIYSVPQGIAEKVMKNNFDINKLEEYITKRSTLVEETRIEKNKKCHRLTINITNQCNLACRYCYANCGDYKQDSLPEIERRSVENAIRQTIELYPEGINLIQLFGGEPLLAGRKLEKIINIIKAVCEEKAVQVPMFGMVTNGTLIDDETAKFLVNNLVSITISLDGSEVVNDFNRRFPGENGQGVYQKVKEAVRLLRKHKTDFFIKCECTVTAENIRDYIQNGKQDNLYHAIFNDIGFNSCLCNPVFGNDNPEISLDKIDLDIVSEYFDSFICGQIHDEEGKLKDIRDIYRIIQVLRKKTSPKNQCGANNTDLAVDVMGNLYPCFMFIGEEKYKIANVNDCDLKEITKRYSEIMDELELANNNVTCNDCWAKRFCSTTCGNCIGARHLANGTIKAPIERNCQIGKRILERFLWEAVRFQTSK
jgi:uncharacterized protein